MSKKKPGMGQYFELEFLTQEIILKNLFFVLFLGFLAIVYIANARYSESTVREIQHLQKDIKENRWEYMSIKSEIMSNSRQTQLADKLGEIGVRVHTGEPKRIVVNDKNDY
jgi:cell division protein FtsL